MGLYLRGILFYYLEHPLGAFSAKATPTSSWSKSACGQRRFGNGYWNKVSSCSTALAMICPSFSASRWAMRHRTPGWSRCSRVCSGTWDICALREAGASPVGLDSSSQAPHGQRRNVRSECECGRLRPLGRCATLFIVRLELRL